MKVNLDGGVEEESHIALVNDKQQQCDTSEKELDNIRSVDRRKTLQKNNLVANNNWLEGVRKSNGQLQQHWDTNEREKCAR